MRKERAKSQTHSFWGASLSVLLHVDTSAPRGRTLDGGTIWSLGIKVPRGDSSGEGRAAHGPLHPAVNRSLETLMALLFVFLLRSWFCHLVDCIAFFCLWGWYLVWFLSPSSPDPCLVFVCVPLFLVSGLFRRRRVFSCLLFLSGAGETQTPFGGFGVPLVFSSSRTRSPTSTRTSRSAPTPRPRPAPVFFFSSSSLVFWVGVFSFWSCRCLWFLVGVLGLWFWSLPGSCIAR